MFGGYVRRHMDNTKRLIEISKELEQLFPSGFMLLFPSETKMGVCAVVFDSKEAPPTFSFLKNSIHRFIKNLSTYGWEKPIDQFRVKE